MEQQSQSNGVAEECHSSESGWTMYIGSTIDDYDEDDDDVDNNDRCSPQADVEDDESDDSMASDASSGPSHRCGNPWENVEDHQEHDDDDKFFLEKKENNRTRGKQIAERKEKDQNETGEKKFQDG